MRNLDTNGPQKIYPFNENFASSSPDSDDTYPGDEQEEDFSMRDDQFLVSDRTENKFYGTYLFVPFRLGFYLMRSFRDSTWRGERNEHGWSSWIHRGS